MTDPICRVRPTLKLKCFPSLVTNGLGLLVLVVSATLLQLLDEGNVLLLGLVRGNALIDELLPSVLLGLALEVEHARARGLGDVLAGTDLEETIKLEKIVVAGLGSELLGVDDGLLEGFALRGRHGESVVGVGTGSSS